MTEAQATYIPEGYMRDPRGNLVPEANIKPIDRMRHDMVMELAKLAERQSADLKSFKKHVFQTIQSFLDLSAEQYGVRLGGAKGNVTLMSFDGRYKVQRAVAEHIVFDERLAIAKELIDQCITKWSEGVNDHIRTLVEHAFRTNRQGHVSTGAILGLRRLNIDDPDWLKAMDAIADSVTSNQTSTYVRFYERIGDTDQYRPIPLDIAAL